MRRGEVWWTDLAGKRRPAMIITRDQAIDLLTDVTVVPATRPIRGYPSEVRIGTNDGMPAESVLKLDELQTVSKRAFAGLITTLSQSRLDEVCESLRYSLGC